MAEPTEAAIEDIKETDIVFDCPYCGKSLAIDYRGAGLSIPCSDCGRDVEVPIPEGMELTDIDSTVEEQELRILNLRRSLATAEARIKTLELEAAPLRTDHDLLEKIKREGGARSGEIGARVDAVRHALEESARKLAEIRDLIDNSQRTEPDEE